MVRIVYFITERGASGWECLSCSIGRLFELFYATRMLCKDAHTNAEFYFNKVLVVVERKRRYNIVRKRRSTEVIKEAKT